MTISMIYENLHIEFDIDGAEESTLDWEGPSYSVRGFKKKKKEVESK